MLFFAYFCKILSSLFCKIGVFAHKNKATAHHCEVAQIHDYVKKQIHNKMYKNRAKKTGAHHCEPAQTL